MYRVTEQKIRHLLDNPDRSIVAGEILEPLSPDNPADLDTCAALIPLAKADPGFFNAIIQKADEIKRRVFGNTVKIFIPVYFSNACVNRCRYCGFSAANTSMPRKTLTEDEFRTEIETVYGMGYRVIELVTSESPSLKKKGKLSRYVKIAKEILDSNKIHDVKSQLILMSWNLSGDEFKTVRDAGLDAFYLWQETYDRELFSELHPKGTRKSDFQSRLEVFDRAIQAGIKNIGMGILFGIAPWEFDLLALVDHGKYLECTYGVTPDALGLPRFKHAGGAAITQAPYPVSDQHLRLAVAIYRLAFPKSHVFLNTREKLPLLMKLLEGGGSETNIACSVYPGGYSDPCPDGQFDVYNYPTDKTLKRLIDAGHQPTHFVAHANIGDLYT